MSKNKKMKAADFIVAIENFALTATAYTDFEDRASEIVANVIAGAPTLRSLTPQTGAKANTTVDMNILDVDVVWTTEACATGNTSNSTLEPRPTRIARLSDRELTCLENIERKLPMIFPAGAHIDAMPAELANKYIDAKAAENGRQLEKAAWQGDTDLPSGNLSKVDGWLVKADSETGSLAGYDTFATFTSANAISIVQAMLADRSETMYEMENLILWMDQPKFAILAQALLAAYGVAGTGAYVNLGNENQEGIQEMIFPGTNLRIRATHGLNGNGSLFMTNENNLRYLTDLESDWETVDLFYDKFHKSLVSDIIFAIGFNYEFPENVVYYKYVAS